MKVNYYNLRKIYYEEIQKNVKNKKKLYRFELYSEEYFLSMKEELENNTYDGGKYNVFLIYRPKIRVIMSQSIYDKTINHYITRYVLGPKLEKYLCPQNAATRKNMGLDYGIKLLKKYIEVNKGYGQFYFLKLDIKKYFYNIDHGILKSLIKNDLGEDEFEIISKIIDSTDDDYINVQIENLSKKYTDLPHYKLGKGLPIGNMSSQFLAIFYLSRLHHYIVHNLHIKHLVIYMDDYILIHQDKDYLKNCYIIIENILKRDYKLELNKNKSYIKSSLEGITFLGYHFKVVNNKTIVSLTRDAKKKIRKRVKRAKYLYENNLCDFKYAFSSINTIKNAYKYANNF